MTTGATPLQTAIHVRLRGTQDPILLVLAWIPPSQELPFDPAGQFLVYGAAGFEVISAHNCRAMERDPMGNFSPVDTPLAPPLEDAR